MVSTSSGEEGLQKVKEVEPDLIILDVMMETTTAGFQVSLQLRSPDPRSEYAAYRHIPILILTAIHTTTSLRFGPDEGYLPDPLPFSSPLSPHCEGEGLKMGEGGQNRSTGWN